MQLGKRSNGVGLDKKRLDAWDALTQKSKELESAARELVEKVTRKEDDHLSRKK